MAEIVAEHTALADEEYPPFKVVRWAAVTWVTTLQEHFRIRVIRKVGRPLGRGPGHDCIAPCAVVRLVHEGDVVVNSEWDAGSAFALYPPRQ
jgi:hypothetical protein